MVNFMELLSAIGLLLAGFIVLVFAGDALVRASVSIAIRFDIKPMIIGLTIIAAGTSAPELMTSLLASMKGSPDIALGNVVGSNIFNILAIVGISCLIYPNQIDRSLARFEMPALLVFTLALVAVSYNLVITPIEGTLFIVALCIFLFLSIRRAKLYPAQSRGAEEDDSEKFKHWSQDIGYLVAGFVGLIIGANLALDGGIAIGRLAGLTERIIGITIISVGTGLPELAASGVAAYRGRDDIAISNVVGSCIMNILLVIGTSSIISPITVDKKILYSDSAWMVGATVALVAVVFLSKKIIGRKLGATFLLSYAAFITFLVMTN